MRCAYIQRIKSSLCTMVALEEYTVEWALLFLFWWKRARNKPYVLVMPVCVWILWQLAVELNSTTALHNQNILRCSFSEVVSSVKPISRRNILSQETNRIVCIWKWKVLDRILRYWWSTNASPDVILFYVHLTAAILTLSSWIAMSE